jgi:serine/threonine protein kinase
MQTVEQLCVAIESHQLMASKDLVALRARWFRPGRAEVADTARFTHWLVANNYLSAFVVNLLVTGKTELLRLNQYQVRDHLKSGPYAGAYLATDPLQRVVAIEVLAATHAADPGMLSAFQAAAAKAMTVHSPQVARTLDVGQDRGWHYLVKEYHEGETLASILQRRGQLAYLPATRIFALALAGLQAIHEAGVPAGELSTECLLLSSAGKAAAGQRTVKILHSGVVRRLFDASALTADNTGIPDEIRLAEPSSFVIQPTNDEPRPADDIFRLGCAFYLTLTGRLAFPDVDLPNPKHAAPLVQEIVSEVPEMLASTVDQMIAIDPKERYQKAANVAKALRVFLSTEEEARQAKVEDNVAAPTSPTAQKAEEPPPEEDDSNDDDARPVKHRPDEGEHGAAVKLAELWDEVRPSNRDLVFLGSGAVAVILAVLFLKILTGW